MPCVPCAEVMRPLLTFKSSQTARPSWAPDSATTALSTSLTCHGLSPSKSGHGLCDPQSHSLSGKPFHEGRKLAGDTCMG